jgi:hypothetical protein
MCWRVSLLHDAMQEQFAGWYVGKMISIMKCGPHKAMVKAALSMGI